MEEESMIKNKHAILIAAGVLSGLLVTTGFATQEQAVSGAAEGASTKASVKVQECSEEMTEVTKKRAEEAVEEARIREEQERLQAEQAAAEEARRQELLRDQELLASLIFCEAGNQPYEGQVAVGAVVLNRVRSAAYPNSISEVIYQSGQFTPAITGWLDSVYSGGSYTQSAYQAAEDAINGSNPIGDCLYFGCGSYGIQIGDHYFH